MSCRVFIPVAALLLCTSIVPAYSEGRGEERARKLLNSQGCKACHSLQDDGGTLAASIEEIRIKLGRDAIRRVLVNPEQRHGNSNIMSFNHLTDDDLKALVNFIQPEQK